MTVSDCLFLPHANKRGVVLDVTTKEGRAELLSLVDRADTVVESISPGRLPDLGVGPAVMRQRRPVLVVVSITAFGHSDPYAIGSRTFDECTRLLSLLKGQWSPVQDAWEVAHDESLIANGRIADVRDAQGNHQRLVANPVKFDEAAAHMKRAPMFAEHTDEVLRELGMDDHDSIELKLEGVIT